MNDTAAKIVESRHATYLENAPLYQYFSDHYTGGPLYASKINPLARNIAGIATVATSQKSGMGRYVTQHSLEDTGDYLNRLYRSACVNLGGPAVDLLAGTIGQPNTVTMTIPAGFEELMDDVDLTGSNFLTFMTSCRSHAAVSGITFILVDSTQAEGEVKTQLDVQVQNIRPFFREIQAVDMLNWRLDPNGKPVEILFRVQIEAPGSILDGADAQSPQYEYRYWDRTQWIVFRQAGESSYEVADQGNHDLGEVPVVPLYHKKVSAFSGESLLKESARYSQLLSNWLSDLDQTTTQQSFSQACLTSEDTPSQVAVGSARVLHLKPSRRGDNGDVIGEERFSYVSPDAAPLATMWSSFFQVLDLANASMSLSPDAETDKSHPESGISRAWRWHAMERRLTEMVGNEQSAVNELFELAARWMGEPEFAGSIVYGTRFDLSSLDQDIQAMLALQKIGLPASAQTELKSRIVKKVLPNMAPEKQIQIDQEIQSMQTAANTRMDRDMMDSIGA